MNICKWVVSVFLAIGMIGSFIGLVILSAVAPIFVAAVAVLPIFIGIVILIRITFFEKQQ